MLAALLQLQQSKRSPERPAGRLSICSPQGLRHTQSAHTRNTSELYRHFPQSVPLHAPPIPINAHNCTPPLCLSPSSINHLHQLPLLDLPYPPQVVIRPRETLDLILNQCTPIPLPKTHAIVPPHQRTHQLSSQRLQIHLQRLQPPMMLHDQMLVAHRPRPHIPE